MFPTREIMSILGELEGRVGLYLHDLTSDELFTINPGLVFFTASTIKIPIQLTVLREVEENRLSLATRIRVTAKNRVGGTGIIKDLDPDTELTIKDLNTLMIILSDNTATNQLIDMVGTDEVTALCRQLGLANTVLERKMMDWDAAQAGLQNLTTAADMGLLLTRLAQGTAVSPEISAAVVKTMKRQQLRGKLPALLPAVPAYDISPDNDEVRPGTVVVASKTGDLSRLQHDVGIFYLPKRSYVLAMLTDELESDSAGIKAIQRVSLAVYKALAAEA